MSLDEEKEIMNDSQFPWLIFTISDIYYAIHSDVISGITTMPEYTPTPTPVPNVKGIFALRGEFVSLVSLRNLFGLPSQEEEYLSFSDILDSHKQEQMMWAEELCNCIRNKEPFSLNTNAFDCSFGKWISSYTSKNLSVAAHLKKMLEPHSLLHHTAAETNLILQSYTGKESEDTVLQSALYKIENQYEPALMKCIDEAKDIFKHHFREMVVLLEHEEKQWGIITDDVICVEFLNEEFSSENLTAEYSSKYIQGVRKSNSLGKEVLIINHPMLLDTITHMM